MALDIPLVTLTSLYGIMFLVIAVQICRVVANRFRWVSFQMGFLCLGWAWMGLRTAYFALTLAGYGGSWLMFALYMLPVNVEFATFSLLVVFYASSVAAHKTGERGHHVLVRYLRWYALGNGLLLVAYAVYMGWVASKDGGVPTSQLLSAQQIFTTTVYWMLEILLAVYSARVIRLLLGDAFRLPFQASGMTNMQAFALTVALLALFFTRCCYDVLSAANVISVSIDSDSRREQLIVFFSFFTWELVPTGLVVAVVWDVSGRSGNAGSDSINRDVFGARTTRYTPINNPTADAPSTQGAPRPRQQQLFANPNRYDSDDENQGAVAASPATFGATGLWQYQRSPISIHGTPSFNANTALFD